MLRRRWNHVVFFELRRDTRVTTGISGFLLCNSVNFSGCPSLWRIFSPLAYMFYHVFQDTTSPLLLHPTPPNHFTLLVWHWTDGPNCLSMFHLSKSISHIVMRPRDWLRSCSRLSTSSPPRPGIFPPNLSFSCSMRHKWEHQQVHG